MTMHAMNEYKPKVISLFSGAGGLDLGFEQAGFEIVWANECDSKIAPTFKTNFPNTLLDTRPIQSIDEKEIPFADGIIGGPPCQSWSVAGARRGIDDERGKLFYDYIRILSYIKPKFFIAENVPGIRNRHNISSFIHILKAFKEIGYDVFWDELNANDYEVPQERRRIFVVGFRKELRVKFQFPEPIKNKKTLRDAIYDLKDIQVNQNEKKGGYSFIYMSRNRVRAWDEPSYTILSSSRHIPMHPQAPKMIDSGTKDKKLFVPGKEDLYRRFTIKECARIQTFPDDFVFIYKQNTTAYTMIGNAVPVKLAYYLANHIKSYLIENHNIN